MSQSFKIFLFPSIIVLISILTESRAFIFGAVFSLFLFCSLSFSLSKKYKIALLLCTVLAFLGLFLYKLDSSLGRILIYKVSGQMLKDNWLTGIGFGKFYEQYLYYQAVYFQNGHYTTKELLLAGNTHYAFNEYWRLIIELGIWIIAPLIALFYFYVRFLFVSLHKNKTLINYTLHFIICTIIIASSFTNTFSRNWIWLTLLIIAFLNVCISQKICVKLLLIFNFFISLGITAISITNYIAERQLKEQTFEFRNGDLGLEEFCKNVEELRLEAREKKIALLQLQSRYYQDEKQWDKALIKTLMLADLKPNHIVFVNLGDIYENLGKMDDAAYWYQLSVNSVPNRFVSRDVLFEFYLRQGKTNEAKRVGTEILNLPVKVHSAIVDSIKEKVKTKLSKL